MQSAGIEPAAGRDRTRSSCGNDQGYHYPMIAWAFQGVYTLNSVFVSRPGIIQPQFVLWFYVSGLPKSCLSPIRQRLPTAWHHWSMEPRQHHGCPSIEYRWVTGGIRLPEGRRVAVTSWFGIKDSDIGGLSWRLPDDSEGWYCVYFTQHPLPTACRRLCSRTIWLAWLTDILLRRLYYTWRMVLEEFCRPSQISPASSSRPRSQKCPKVDWRRQPARKDLVESRSLITQRIHNRQNLGLHGRQMRSKYYPTIIWSWYSLLWCSLYFSWVSPRRLLHGPSKSS